MGGVYERAGSLCGASLLEVTGRRGATEGCKREGAKVTAALTKGNAGW